MFRVLLVDDEAMARKGLRATFDWEGCGFKVVGEASNGQKAMPWIEKQDVDILITDIAMPIMDGLELTRLTREKCPWVKVVLLSCHSDFDYVREGIRLGASDYLLKPTLELEELQKILEKIKQQIINEKEQLDLMQEHRDQDKRMQLEKIIIKWVAGEMLPGEPISLAWLTEGYRVIVTSFDVQYSCDQRKEEGLLGIIIQDAQNLFYKEFRQGIAFRMCADQLVLILPCSPTETIQSHCEKIEMYRDRMKHQGFVFTMGMSNVNVDLIHLRQAYLEAKKAMRLRFYHGPGGLYIVPPSPPPSSIGSNYFAEAILQLKKLIMEGNNDAAGHCLKGLLRQWTYEYKTPEEVLNEAKEIIWLFYICKEGSIRAIEQIEMLNQATSASEICSILWDNFESLWNIFHTEIEGDHSFHQRIVHAALEFIDAHYTEMISLQDIADHVSISKNYFSELFKKVTGENFIDYLIHLRVNHAKQLLNSTTLKIYEVAQMSGFNDVKYFSKLFKKIVHMSPADFRGGSSSYIKALPR
jgi:two-component system response regulator YesN